MIKYFRVISIFLLSVAVAPAMAQSTATTSSPYSKYGLGLFNQPLLPQNRAMGGIATATNKINDYNNINMLNPASYSAISLTTIDAGLYSNFVTLSKTGFPDQKNSNFRLSHLAFGIPVSKRSALSFGLLPYTELGYQYKQTVDHGFGSGSPADTNVVNYVYSGEGGLSKAYLGYGFAIGKHIAIGGNMSYIFGNLKQYSSTELPNLYGSFNSRQEENNSIGGLNFDYGIQYTVNFGEEKHLVFGYAGSSKSKINSDRSFIVSQYQTDYSNDDEEVAADSVVVDKNSTAKIMLPQINHFGLSYQVDHKFLVGADYSMGNWSDLSINGVNQGLQNSNSIAVGGQFTPNANALNSYLAVVDYRLGFHYDKTNISINNQDIKQYGVTFGLGLPLARNGTAFYKVNFAGEVGQRGTLSNSLIKETYFTFHLSFTLNDKWFIKYKYD